MAEYTGEEHRIGSIDDRTQVKNPQTGLWTKRSRKESAKFMEDKSDGEPFKDVAKEPDGRRR